MVSVHYSAGAYLVIVTYHFLCHDSQEVSKGDFPCAILVHVTYHLFDLLLLGLKPQGSHRHLGRSVRGEWRVKHTWEHR